MLLDRYRRCKAHSVRGKNRARGGGVGEIETPSPNRKRNFKFISQHRTPASLSQCLRAFLVGSTRSALARSYSSGAGCSRRAHLWPLAALVRPPPAVACEASSAPARLVSRLGKVGSRTRDAVVASLMRWPLAGARASVRRGAPSLAPALARPEPGRVIQPVTVAGASTFAPHMNRWG